MSSDTEKDFQIESADEFHQDEATDAKEYWSGAKFEYYKKKRTWSGFMADNIATFEPQSVLEFGCNAGKNLSVISEAIPNCFVSGIDINGPAINWGREQGLNLAVGDERNLETFPDNSFDVIFTVSVLDHLPFPKKALESMIRVSRRAVLLLEPWMGEEGKVVRNLNLNTGELIDTTPFSYSWDYQKLGEEVAPDWKLESEPYGIPSNLGRFYQLFKFIAPQEKQ